MAQRSRSRTHGPSRRHEVCVEGLEPRDLLSVLPLHRAQIARVAHAITSAQTPTPTPAPAPTPHEVVREQFSARFQGQFFTGPGRFTDEALRTQMNAGGTSNQFLHGNVLINIASPKDPTRPVTGTAQLFEKNVSTTGTILVLDLTGTAPADPTRPPSHLTWTVNSSSSGTYTN